MPSPTLRAIFFAAVLTIAVIGVYYPVHRQPFANYDDPDYVSDNYHVRAGLHWSTVTWAMTTRAAANWHPVTWLSHALDCQLFGVTPAGPHDVNLVLHLLNALLLFWVLQRATGFWGRSAMVAALFALHPINVESVAWIAERKNLLSMFFFLLTLAAYRWYALAPRAAGGAPNVRGRRYLLVVVLFALGLMSKPQVITLPFVLLLWDYWPLQRVAVRHPLFAFRKKSGDGPDIEGRRAKNELRSLIVEKLPLFALALMSAAITLNAQSAGGATSGYSYWLRLENAIISYARYLGNAFWPSRLTLFYPYPVHLYPAVEVLGASLLLIAITAAVFVSQRRYSVMGWLWFLGTLVPMIGVIQVGTQAMADRYAYLPFVGLFIMVSWFIADMASAAHIPPILLRVASVMVLFALAVASHRQVEFWKDHITLWSHALDVTQNNFIAENNLGTTLLKLSRSEEAIPHFRAALAINPTDPNSNLNIGIYEQMHGNFPAAIQRYAAAAGYARNPKTKARAYNNLGYAYKATGDYIHAGESFQHAVDADPEYTGAWISLGLVAQHTGDLRLAQNAYSRALQLYPSDYGFLLLASAFEASGDKASAESARQKAASLSSDLPAAQRYADQLLNPQPRREIPAAGDRGL